MNLFFVIMECWIICCVHFASAEEEIPAQATIVGEIADGKPASPAPPPALPDFRIKSTVVHEMDVVETPEMSGLPIVEGTITATVHLVEDPKLPDSMALAAPVLSGSQQNQVITRIGERRQKINTLVFSVTVYDHSRSLLRFLRNSNVKREVTVWSNLDFNHFSGFTSFQVQRANGDVQKYSLVMNLGNEDIHRRTALLAKRGISYHGPDIPDLPDGNPAYMIMGASPDPETLQSVKDLHELYRCEGQRMANAYEARLQAQVKQRADLLAHPKVPQDVTIQFWERDHPVGLSTETIKKGEGN